MAVPRTGHVAIMSLSYHRNGLPWPQHGGTMTIKRFGPAMARHCVACKFITLPGSVHGLSQTFNRPPWKYHGGAEAVRDIPINASHVGLMAWPCGGTPRQLAVVRWSKALQFVDIGEDSSAMAVQPRPLMDGHRRGMGRNSTAMACAIASAMPLTWHCPGP